MKQLLTLFFLAAAMAMYAQPASVTSIEIGGRGLDGHADFNNSEPLIPLGGGVFYWEGIIHNPNPNASSGNQGFKFVLNSHVTNSWNDKWGLTAKSENLQVEEDVSYETNCTFNIGNDNKWLINPAYSGHPIRVTIDASNLSDIRLSVDYDPEPLLPTVVPGVFLHFNGDNPNLATELQATGNENVFTLAGRFLQPNKQFNIQINKGTPTYLNASAAANIPLWTEQTLIPEEADGEKFTFTNMEGWYILTVDTAAKTVKIAPPAIEKIYIAGRCPANVGGYGNSIERLDELVNEGDGIFSWTGLLTDIKPDGSTGADFKFSLNDKFEDVRNAWWYTLTAENGNTVISNGGTYAMRPTGDIAANFSDTKWKIADSGEDGAYKLTVDIKTLTLSVEKISEVEGVFVAGTALPINADAFVVHDPSFRLYPLGEGKFRARVHLAENGTLKFFINKINKIYLSADSENEPVTNLCQAHKLTTWATEGDGFVNTLPTGYYDVFVDTIANEMKIIGEEECSTTSIPKSEIAELRIYVKNGNIIADFEGSKSVALYSVTGQTLYRGVANGNFSYIAPKGVYLLNIGGVKTKVIVR
jgi:hypothetical protein